MKIKELQKTVNVAWSPSPQYPIFLAAGTAVQQLEASNANSVLEIYSANLSDPSYDLELKASQTSPFGFQKVIWSPAGFGGAHPNGLIVGGCEGGHLQIYSASKLLSGEDGLIARQDKHAGSIRGLDFNPFQHNLLASVATESEIFIWDLNNSSTPMAPGTKTQPLEDIQNVAWNKQVQHILASVFSSRCVIWDLRKNEQIIKLSDSQSRVRWRAIQWHPDIATQLWLASEDDQSPFVQLWDLRYATAPAKTVQIHQRGILGLAWCSKDSDLMVSCGKDNKIFCWNPNSEKPDGEILSEVATTIQWYSDIQWCPRNPAIIASSSLEGNVSIYSLFGGSHQQVQTSNKIADSFPGMDQFAQAPIPPSATQILYTDLKKTPKWMKRSVGVSFGFGGRLVIHNQKKDKTVKVFQIVTEKDLIDRSNSLQKTLDEGNFINYCRQRADEMTNQSKRYLWYFLKANFEEKPKDEMLNLLGYNKTDIVNKFENYVKRDPEPIDELTNQIGTLTHSDSSEVEGDQSTDDSTDISGGDNNGLFESIAAENRNLDELHEKNSTPYKIPVGQDADGLICQAILSGNLKAAVEICLSSDKEAEALVIASVEGNEFLQTIQKRYLNKKNSEVSKVISALVAHDWSNVMSWCTIDSWKEALVAALTHHETQSAHLCVILGERLQSEKGDQTTAQSAMLCYICAGNLEKLVDAWLELRAREKGSNVKLNTNEIQDLVEVVMLLKKGLENQGYNIEPSGKVAEILSDYAALLAAQGELQSALSYLGPSIDPNLVELRERLYYALGHKQKASYSQANVSKSQPNMYDNYFQKRPSITGQRSATPQSNFNTGLSGAFPSQQPQIHPWNVTPSMSTTGPSPAPFNPTQMFPPAPVQAKPPPTFPPPNEALNQPQRPSSVGSLGGTPVTRAKYVVDPSVINSGPSYSQSSVLYNPPQPDALNPQSHGSAFNQYNSSALNQQALPPSAAYQNQQISNPPISNNFKPFIPAQMNANQIFNPNIHQSGMQSLESEHQPVLPPPPSHKNPTPPPGWNDPPVLKSTRSQVHYKEHNEMSAKHAGTRRWERIRASHNADSQDIEPNQYLLKNYLESSTPPQSKTGQISANPIVHPLFGVNTAQGQNGYVDPSVANNNFQFQNQGMQPSPPMHQQQMSFSNQSMLIPEKENNLYNPNDMSSMSQQLHSTLNQQPPPASRNVEPPVQKAPIPEEFIYLQTVLEELKNQCINTAPDPRTKRKIADVGRRLEGLYDALRDERLTQNTLSSLNQIVQSIQVGDYGNAMGVLTLVASGPDFAQTASFMPGIKVLIQSASELKIYLR